MTRARASRPALARATAALRRTRHSRLRRAGFWQEPIISPYVDRLAAAASDGHRCSRLLVRLP